MLALKIIFCVLICIPLGWLALALFGSLMERVLKDKR